MQRLFAWIISPMPFATTRTRKLEHPFYTLAWLAGSATTGNRFDAVHYVQADPCPVGRYPKGPQLCPWGAQLLATGLSLSSLPRSDTGLMLADLSTSPVAEQDSPAPFRSRYMMRLPQ